MKKLVLLLILFRAIEANAQNYLITFTGTGASTTVSTVKVENLTAGTFLTVNGSDILRLTITTGINSIDNRQSSKLKIYPNPMTGNTTFEIYPPVEGNAVITVCDMTGRQITQIQSYLENSKQDFTLSGLKNGFYFITVKGNNYQFSGKLVSNGISDGTISIDKVNSITQSVVGKTEKADNKGVQATVDMAYTTGDRLKFTGISGVYNTVMTDIPSADKIINFNFIDCTDGDNNNYPVVEIGAQVWMAENLKVTHYRNGDPIPNVTDGSAWGALTTGAFCDYENTSGNGTTYGKLYNWHTVVDSRNLCLTGWHVPTHTEWLTLNTYLGDGMTAGGKLKETGTAHWSSPNTGATNETGFTALPGGYRSGIDGTFADITKGGNWQSATEIDVLNSYGGGVVFNYGFLATVNGNKENGYSVRCLKDN